MQEIRQNIKLELAGRNSSALFFPINFYTQDSFLMRDGVMNFHFCYWINVHTLRNMFAFRGLSMQLCIDDYLSTKLKYVPYSSILQSVGLKLTWQFVYVIKDFF